jgi:hypothetical protein
MSGRSVGDATIQLIFSNPVEGRDDEFNDWYDNVHVREVLAIPGMVSAQRFDLCETEILREAGRTSHHRYLCMYEMEGDVDAIMAKIREAAASGAIYMSDTLDLTDVAMSFWTPHGPTREA